MKHYLNFKPSIVFRKGSSFMLKTSMLILYGLPLTLVFFWSYSYFSLKAINVFYSDALAGFEKKNSSFTEELNKTKPDPEELKEAEASYFAYRRVGTAFKTSWSVLFKSLEEITPGDVMFKRVKIKPDKLVKVMIDGEAEKLGSLTTFLKMLFSNKKFLNPMLRKHARLSEKSSSVSFSLEVDYLGERGELP